MTPTGLDRLLAETGPLTGRRYGLLCHQASVSLALEPCHLALARRGVPPAVLFGPEHGFYGVEQDMVPADNQTDPLSGCPIVSLYGDQAESLRPQPEAMEGLDLLVVDLQDVGARYYTFAATAVWSAEVALEAGLEVWVLDRPNPLGGDVLEGNLPDPAYQSFVGAFSLPVRHGLTLGEILLLEAQRRGWERRAIRIFEAPEWRRSVTVEGWQRPWVAPSPNMPSAETVWLYPGGCLVEGTELSEGRGTTRPFRLIGAPQVDPREIVADLEALTLAGVRFLPTYFRPLAQKHAGEVCGGVEIVILEPQELEPLRLGVELLFAFARRLGDRFRWREKPYEFVTDRSAIDLLAGSDRLRMAIDDRDRVALDEWMSSFRTDVAVFRDERQGALLYPA